MEYDNEEYMKIKPKKDKKLYTRWGYSYEGNDQNWWDCWRLVSSLHTP